MTFKHSTIMTTASIEVYTETGYHVPLATDSYSVQQVGKLWHVVNPDGVVIGECTQRRYAVQYANRQNKAHGLNLVDA
jgi:hypothetical protein